jgi:hypothetical protein
MDFKTPWIDYPVKQIVESTGTIQETIGDPGLGGDPAFFAGQAAGGAAPFALATGHQIPQGAFAGLFGRTTPIWEHRTITYTDKLPITDITGHFPYPD